MSTSPREAVVEQDQATPCSPPVDLAKWSREAGKARQSLFEKASADVPVKVRGIFDRSWAGAASPRTAIKAKCQECTGYEDMVQRIGQCTAYKCPLWAYRPFQTEGENE